MTTSRTDFNETWLSEMPARLGKVGNFLPAIVSLIKERQSTNSTVDLTNGFYKIEGEQIALYWHESNNGIIDLAAEFSKKPQGLMVNGVGKSKTASVYASDLYSLVLHDRKKITGEISAVRLMSDTMLSDNGIKLWKQLLTNGHSMFVYDYNSPTDFHAIKTITDLETFIGDSPEFKRYQFVITESHHLVEVKSHFLTRRMRELSGLGTSD